MMKVARYQGKEQYVLVLDGTRITSERFLRAASNFFALLKSVSDDVASQKDALSWIVSAREGSLQILARPEANRAEEKYIPKAIKAIDNGVASLEKKAIRPRHFSDSALANLRELASVVSDDDGDIQRVKIRHGKRVNTLSQHSIANIIDILGMARKENGSVEGKIALISDRRGFRVYVDDIITGQAVRCIVKKELEQKLIDSFRRRVVVSGIVHYRKDGEPISIEVQAVRQLGKRDDLPSFEDVRGILRED